MPLTLFDDDEEKVLEDEEIPDLDLGALVLEDEPVTNIEDEDMEVPKPKKGGRGRGSGKKVVAPEKPPLITVDLPDTETLRSQFEDRPRIYLGPFAIVIQDRLNITVHYWTPRTNRETKEIYYGFALLGYFPSLRSALAAIARETQRCTLSLANHQTLSQALQLLDRTHQELVSLMKELTASDFTSGTVKPSELLWKLNSANNQ